MPGPDNPARPTPRMVRLYHRFVELVGAGEPPDLWVYEPHLWRNPTDRPAPTLKHVMVWPADDETDVCTFQTLGMSDRLMPGADYAAELHMGVREYLRKPDRERVARFLANVAEYPFDHGRTLDWWHVVSQPGDIPHFPGCRHLLVHPKFADEGFDEVDDEGGPVRVLYVVPITPHERHLLIDHGKDAFLDYAADHEIDLFRDRTDPS